MDATMRGKVDLAIQAALMRGREEIVPINKKKVSTRGNLRYNATDMMRINESTWEIYVSGDGEHGIAPYAPFTNEPWLSPRWGGKQNPNEGWFGRFVEFVANDIAKTLGGVVVKGE